VLWGRPQQARPLDGPGDASTSGRPPAGMMPPQLAGGGGAVPGGGAPGEPNYFNLPSAGG
jgi:hypothetical protein